MAEKNPEQKMEQTTSKIPEVKNPGLKVRAFSSAITKVSSKSVKIIDKAKGPLKSGFLNP